MKNGMENNIERKIDKLLKSKSKNKGKMHVVKLMSGLVIFMLVMVSVSAFLLTVYDSYYGDMEGQISTEGITSEIMFDGEYFIIQTNALDMDCTNLTAGETETYTHTVLTERDISCFVTFDISGMTWFDDPEHEFYGFGFSVWNSDETEDITDEMVQALPDTELSIVFRYELDENFAHNGENDVPFDLAITFADNTPPVAEPDSVCLPWYTYDYELYVSTNDHDAEGVTEFDITAIDTSTLPVGVEASIGGTYPDEYVKIGVSSNAPLGACTMTYTISDGELTSIGTITITVVEGT